MKMKAKLLLIVLLPLIVMGIVTVIVSNSRISNVVTDNIENGLRAAAVSVRDTIQNADDGAFSVDASGALYKGTYNITEHVEIADNIQEATDMDITVFYGDTRYMTSICKEDGSRQVGTQASEVVTEEVLKKGNDYFARNVDVQGQAYFGYYVPIAAEDGTIEGMVFAGMPQSEARAEIMKIITLLIGIILAMGLICCVTVAIVVTNLTNALHKGTDALEEVAEGRLNAELDERITKRRDEIGHISRSIVKLKQQQSEIIQSMKEQSEALNQASTYLSDKTAETSSTVAQVEKAVEEVAEGATSQAEETQTATDNVVLMGNMVSETAREVEAMYSNAKNMHALGQDAFETLHELSAINQQASESIQAIYEQTNMTNESVQKIKEATGLITAIAAETNSQKMIDEGKMTLVEMTKQSQETVDVTNEVQEHVVKLADKLSEITNFVNDIQSIASQTNLLSLNASIEAARAGEQGRGFAVVATQIQQLADQSNASARQIEEIISYLITDSGRAVKTMEVVKDIMEKQNENVQHTDERFQKVISGIEESLEAIERITEKTSQLDTTRSSVIDTVQSLSAIAEENAASTEETFASITEISSIIEGISAEAEQLKKIANGIDRSMEIFELE